MVFKVCFCFEDNQNLIISEKIILKKVKKVKIKNEKGLIKLELWNKNKKVSENKYAIVIKKENNKTYDIKNESSKPKKVKNKIKNK